MKITKRKPWSWIQILGAALIPLSAHAVLAEEIDDSEAFQSMVAASSEVLKDAVSSEMESYFIQEFGLTLNNVFWGEFHSHSKYSLDGAKCNANPPDRAFRYARDTAKLSFIALCDHAEEQNEKAIPSQDKKQGLNNWESLLKAGQKYNNEDPSGGKVFIVFPAWEYTNTHGLPGVGGSMKGYGHKNVVFKDLDPALLPEDEYGAFNVDDPHVAHDATKLWEKLEAYRPPCDGCEGTALTIVHTPANVGEGTGDAKDHRTDWDVVDRDFVRHVEIYSKWGNSEGPPPPEMGCTDEPFEYTSAPQSDPLFVRPILYSRWIKGGDRNFLLGILGGTDNHKGQPGNSSTDQCGFPYRGGITGILAPSLARDNLWTNLWNRRTQATSTGARIPILFAVEASGRHLLMGDQGDHDGTVHVRALSQNATKLEIILDGCVHSVVNGSVLDTTLTDLGNSRHYIYIRASLQKNKETFHAWTSPVYLGSLE
ncbi:MAG: hypothetical protein EHM36_09540 [Deltaproteobacteria bacterium]|nr:MAG: hypothetical protein EHM36_09540 [Deltaproteobacteria bacterium]